MEFASAATFATAVAGSSTVSGRGMQRLKKTEAGIAVAGGRRNHTHGGGAELRQELQALREDVQSRYEALEGRLDALLLAVQAKGALPAVGPSASAPPASASRLSSRA